MSAITHNDDDAPMPAADELQPALPVMWRPAKAKQYGHFVCELCPRRIGKEESRKCTKVDGVTIGNGGRAHLSCTVHGAPAGLEQAAQRTAAATVQAALVRTGRIKSKFTISPLISVTGAQPRLPTESAASSLSEGQDGELFDPGGTAAAATTLMDLSADSSQRGDDDHAAPRSSCCGECVSNHTRDATPGGPLVRSSCCDACDSSHTRGAMPGGPLVCGFFKTDDKPSAASASAGAASALPLLSWPSLLALIADRPGARSSFTMTPKGGIMRLAEGKSLSVRAWWERWRRTELPALLRLLHKGTLNGRMATYLSAVDAPAALMRMLDCTMEGRLYGVDGLCSVRQHLPSRWLAAHGSQLGTPPRLFLAPPAPGIVFTPPHLDGWGRKVGVHWVLPFNDRAFNRLQTWTPEQYGVAAAFSPLEPLLHAHRARKQFRVDANGGSTNKGDRTAWCVGGPAAPDELEGDVHRIAGGQVVVMPPRLMHLFHKQLDALMPKEVGELLDQFPSQRAASTADAVPLHPHGGLNGPPLVGVSYDSFVLGHDIASARAYLTMYKEHSDAVWEANSACSKRAKWQAYLFPLPLLLFRLATLEQPAHVIHAAHVLAAEPLIRAAMEIDAKALAATPSARPVSPWPPSARGDELDTCVCVGCGGVGAFNLAFVHGERWGCPRCISTCPPPFRSQCEAVRRIKPCELSKRLDGTVAQARVKLQQAGFSTHC